MTHQAPIARDALSELATLRHRPGRTSIRIPERGPTAPTRFRVGDTVAAVLGSIGAVVGDIVQDRGGPAQSVSCDPWHAIGSLAMSTLVQLPDGKGGWKRPAPHPDRDLARACIRPWPTRDGRHVLPHLSLPNLQARMLNLLDCELDPDAVAAAVARWGADDLEQAIADHRVCGGKVRSEAEWRAHPHGRILAARPVITIERIGDAPAEPVPGGKRPLSGLKVLDLTRILAGPVAARTLAEHGADVLMVAAPKTPQVDEFVRDTSHGKRSCFLDLDIAEDAATLRELARTADVFSQGYRPGTLSARGFGPEDLARLRPGIVYLSVSCYGHGGPLSDRAGWEQVAQTVTGICHEQGPEGAPELIPLPACDYLTGYLGALGALIALERRADEGGSWHVQVSLCRSAMFLQDQGRWPEKGEFP
ncbi:MAG: CoA transferase, partial [Pseudooceanicola sp.]